MREELKFSLYDGYLMGLPTDANHLVFRYHGDGKILFSAAQKGNAISAHFASDKKGLRHLKRACDEFVLFCFDAFPWCEMVIAHVGKKSIGRMIEKIGFSAFATTDQGTAYLRARL